METVVVVVIVVVVISVRLGQVRKVAVVVVRL
jgi:hypothetical protein